MPFLIKRVGDSKYKVCKRDEPTECFSKEGIPKERAEAQLRAIGMSGGAEESISEKLNKYSIKKLKEIIKEYNLHYHIKVSGLKKKDIIDKMAEHLVIEDNIIKSKNPDFAKELPKDKDAIKLYKKTYREYMKLPPKYKSSVDKEFIDNIKKVLEIS